MIYSVEKNGPLERYFRPEGKLKDSVCALPVDYSRLRLYCLKISDKILILGNGDEKKTQTYEEDEKLKGYVLTLQQFEEALKKEKARGNVEFTEEGINTEDNIFEI